MLTAAACDVGLPAAGVARRARPGDRSRGDRVGRTSSRSTRMPTGSRSARWSGSCAVCPRPACRRATRCPLCTSYPWWRFDELLADVGPEIDDGARRGIRRADRREPRLGRAVRRTRALGAVPRRRPPEQRDRWSRGPVIIDWDLLCLGPPGWDHAPLCSMVARWGACPSGTRSSPGATARTVAGSGDPIADDPAPRRRHADAGEGGPHRTPPRPPKPSAACATGAAIRRTRVDDVVTGSRAVVGIVAKRDRDTRADGSLTPWGRSAANRAGRRRP